MKSDHWIYEVTVPVPTQKVQYIFFYFFFLYQYKNILCREPTPEPTARAVADPKQTLVCNTA